MRLKSRGRAATIGMLCALAGTAQAAQLDPQRWILQDLSGNPLAGLTDNKLETHVTLRREARDDTPAGMLIDLGGPCVLHRVVLTGRQSRMLFWDRAYENRDKPPRGLVVVYVGEDKDARNPVAEFAVPYDAGDPIDTEIDVRFQPAAGRFLRIELQTGNRGKRDPGKEQGNPAQPTGPDPAWNVAELELYGFTGPGALVKENAVVLPKGAAGPLAVAAGELCYYLGELAGKPHPVVAPDEAGGYPGTLYRIVDLKPLALSYDEMTKNAAAGKLPGGVRVERDGREVLFSAWPYRAVLWSVWEFLERQGVRWLYPDAHGDQVPTGQGVKLDMLPLRQVPSASRIYANFAAGGFLPWPAWVKQPVRQEFLYVWRNRWTESWGGFQPVLGGEEIPSRPPTRALRDEYKEKFDGYPHNLDTVVPARILKAHPAWWGYSRQRQKRLDPGMADAPMMCLTHPELIRWVADKMAEVHQTAPQRIYNLLPMDGCRHCECDACAKANSPEEPNPVPWVKMRGVSLSGAYYQFVCEVAKAVRERGGAGIVVGALAYADVFLPPRNIPSFPDNVQVEVCLYGSPNLPMGAPPNSALKQAWDTWHAKCKRLTYYDYALLQEGMEDRRLPVPMVTAIADRAGYLRAVGAMDGGTQASADYLPYNPWNFYAYPRTRWSAGPSAETLLREFFAGYYREAGAPMLAYYKAMEDYHLAQNVDLHAGGYRYGITPGSFPMHILSAMKKHLEEAERKARHWVVAKRVATMREAFDWLLAERGLKGANLENVSADAAVQAGAAPLIVDLRKMRKFQFAEMTPGGERVFWAQGRIETSLFFARQGRCTISVVARGVPHEDEWPVMEVFLGAKRAGYAAVSSKEYREHRFEAEVPAGVWDLLIRYQNAAEGGRRNLYIQEIRLSQQS